MCGRFTSTTPVEALAEAFAVDEVAADELGPRYNVAPTQPILAVARRSSGALALGAFRWGLVPSWAKDASVGSRMINARAEGIGSKPAYRAALARRRCLIPADDFYEWQVVAGGAAGGGVVVAGGGVAGGGVAGGGEAGGGDEAGGGGVEAGGGGGAGRGGVRRGRGRAPKQPWAVRRRDGAPMALAGLWEVWRDPADPGAPPLRTAVIVTTSANATLAPIHDRMPVILEAEAWPRWLDTDDGSGAGPPLDLLVPAGEAVVEAHPVSMLVNAVSRDGPELLEPVDALPG